MIQIVDVRAMGERIDAVCDQRSGLRPFRVGDVSENDVSRIDDATADKALPNIMRGTGINLSGALSAELNFVGRVACALRPGEDQQDRRLAFRRA
ncbi:hypothetical protein GHL01_00550 [Sinorhizobium meliloti]|uniref:hypothetical protein n=1 Tax=Rhizobium meliloti TaxID=382 RepID=UPI001296D6DD|nr:hypothetical protein [Sinorhizobium meliloti]MQV12235.1 hypothetical protein [Sinorhizobium meliloti]